MISQEAEFLRLFGPQAGEEAGIELVRTVFQAEPDDWQAEVLRDFCRFERHITIRACHGVGKSTVAAWCIWIQLLTRFPQRSVATAPTAHQVFNVLFADVVAWGRKLHPKLRALFTIQSDRIFRTVRPEESYFTVATARPETPEALQGIHSKHVLIVVDEASGVPDPNFAAAGGSMSSTIENGDQATMLLLGNPTRGSGYFYNSHNVLRHMFRTYHVTGVPDTSGIYSRRMGKSYEEEKALLNGRDSNEFRVRCLGEFPKADDDTVIPQELVEDARNREIEVPQLPEVWGLDVARFGSNSNVLCRRNRVAVTGIERWAGRDIMQTVGRVKARFDALSITEQPNDILVDDIAVGGGVTDRLRELGLPARGVNVGEVASSTEKYANLRSELPFKAKEWLSSRASKLPVGSDKDDPEERLANQLVIFRYDYTSSGKLMVESKRDIKKRIGSENSPDEADAFFLTFASEPATMFGGARSSTRWGQPLRRNLKCVV